MLWYRVARQIRLNVNRLSFTDMLCKVQEKLSFFYISILKFIVSIVLSSGGLFSRAMVDEEYGSIK